MSGDDVDLRSLRRTSTRAGAVSLVGAVIVFAGLAYSGLRLRDLQEEVRDVEARIAALRPVRDQLEAAKAALTRDNEELARLRDGLVEARAALEEERVKLTTEVESLRSERDRLREGYQATLALTRSGARLPAASRAAVDEITETLPISAVARPQASREPIDDRRSLFAVWLELPAGWGERVERVTYLFNHPSFRDAQRSGSDASDGFRVTYTGWGCLDSVVATVALKNGNREKIVLDMCALLRRDGERVEVEPPGRASAATLEPDRPAVKRPIGGVRRDGDDGGAPRLEQTPEGGEALEGEPPAEERPARPRPEQVPSIEPTRPRQLPTKIPLKEPLGGR